MFKKVVPEDMAARAKLYYSEGLCCSEAVVMTFAETTKLEDPNILMKMSSGLCGGLGYGDICGALTGCACGIGLFFGRSDVSTAPRIKASTISKKMAVLFEDQLGSCKCDDLVRDMEKGSPEQRKKCGKIVEESMLIASRLINANL